MPKSMTDINHDARHGRIQKRLRIDLWLRQLVFLLGLVPLIWLFIRFSIGDLGANPIEAVTRYLGDWALRFLLIALAVTPTRILTGWSIFMSLRRMLGLFAFFYVTLHLLSYVVLDQYFYWAEIWQDITKRTYITLGILAVLMLLPLAITSTNKMIKRLGGRRWRRIHMLIYPAGILGVIHFYMMTKADFLEPIIYGFILLLLFGVRLYKKLT